MRPSSNPSTAKKRKKGREGGTEGGKEIFWSIDIIYPSAIPNLSCWAHEQSNHSGRNSMDWVFGDFSGGTWI
jgi:hypothetical protein